MFVFLENQRNSSPSLQIVFRIFKMSKFQNKAKLAKFAELVKQNSPRAVESIHQYLH